MQDPNPIALNAHLKDVERRALDQLRRPRAKFSLRGGPIAGTALLGAILTFALAAWPGA